MHFAWIIRSKPTNKHQSCRAAVFQAKTGRYLSHWGAPKRQRFLWKGKYLDWVAPPILPAIWIRPAEGSGEEQYISLCFRYVFAGANHQAGFTHPWRAIGWFNTMTTSSQLRTESFELGLLITPLVLKKLTAASPDQAQSTIELGLAIARLVQHPSS